MQFLSCHSCVVYQCVNIILLLVSKTYGTRIPSYRICKPGPPLGYPVKPNLKNCLIIGDSISIGYTPYVKKILSDVCQVQHAPWDSFDGGALDTKYGLMCISLFLATTGGKDTHYDAIVFNFGLHDIQYCPGKYKEEYVPYAEYLNNMGFIYSRLNLGGAKLGFVSSTPVPYSKVLNDRVKKYNRGVKMLFNTTTLGFVDLYEKVIDICGEPPFKNCSIMNKQPNVHYQPKGYSYLAKYVSQLFLTLLKQSRHSKKRSSHELKARHSAQEQRQKGQLVQRWKICPKQLFIAKNKRMELTMSSSCKPQKIAVDYELNVTTACPSEMTCCKSIFSRTGVGCCMIPDAYPCSDGLHCCPSGMKFSEDCEKETGICFCETQNAMKWKQTHLNAT